MSESITKTDKYLAYLNGEYYDGDLPEPFTKTEKYLYKLCTDGIGTSKEAIAEAVQTYLTDKGVGLSVDSDGYACLKATGVENNG